MPTAIIPHKIIRMMERVIETTGKTNHVYMYVYIIRKRGSNVHTHIMIIMLLCNCYSHRSRHPIYSIYLCMSTSKRVIITRSDQFDTLKHINTHTHTQHTPERLWRICKEKKK